jgi:hypothetical protein
VRRAIFYSCLLLLLGSAAASISHADVIPVALTNPLVTDVSVKGPGCPTAGCSAVQVIPPVFLAPGSPFNWGTDRLNGSSSNLAPILREDFRNPLPDAYWETPNLYCCQAAPLTALTAPTGIYTYGFTNWALPSPEALASTFEVLWLSDNEVFDVRLKSKVVPDAPVIHLIGPDTYIKIPVAPCGSFGNPTPNPDGSVTAPQACTSLSITYEQIRTLSGFDFDALSGMFDLEVAVCNGITVTDSSSAPSTCMPANATYDPTGLSLAAVVVPAPEPSSIVLLIMGLVGLLSYRLFSLPT